MKEKKDKVINNETSNTEIVDKIKDLLERMRPFLVDDGGDLEYVDYKDNIVYVRLTGACKDCYAMDITLKDGIEEMLINEIPEVKEVINVE